MMSVELYQTPDGRNSMDMLQLESERAFTVRWIWSTSLSGNDEVRRNFFIVVTNDGRLREEYSIVIVQEKKLLG